MHTVGILLGVVQVAMAIGLIFLVDIQQSKNEGLGGTIEGRPTSSFKGMPGMEERLSELTKQLGIAFMITSIVVAILMSR